MKTRIITAVVAIALLIPVLIFSDTVALPILLSLCAILAVYEMTGCIGIRKAFPIVIPLYLAAAGLPFLVRYLRDLDGVRKYSFAILSVLLIYFFAVLTFSHGKYKLPEIAVLYATVLYILIGFNSILVLRDYEPGGQYVYLTVFISAWVTDTFAYFCGILFGRGGKHKLIPDVSPKKTVEGSIGGIVFCVLSMVIFGLIINRISDLRANLLLLVAGGLIASVVSQIGDLCMSVIKRHYGIKDYGFIFPGHGGVLDRFDSVLAVSVILTVFCSFFHFFEVVA